MEYTSGLRVGYSFWNYISDIEKDTPGGGNFYIPDLVLEMTQRGHTVIALQPDRDAMRASELGTMLPFGDTFIPEKRKRAYKALKFDMGFPDLDVVLVEWRWPIPGRNTFEDRTKPGFTTDLMRQTEIMNYYRNSGATVILWDLDHKLTINDEVMNPKAHIIETAVQPRTQRTARHRVHIPFHPDNMMDHQAKDLRDSDTKAAGKNLVAYIGNYYERDRSIDDYIKPVSDAFEGGVNFVGNWLKYPEQAKIVTSRWPNIVYHDRIGKDRFQEFYGNAYTCPLMAKDSYYARGFLTARYLEALYFRCLPIGFHEFLGIENYLQPSLIVHDAEDYIGKLNDITDMSANEREDVFRYQFNYLDPFHPSHFVDKIENLYGKSTMQVPGFSHNELEKELEERFA